MREADMQRERKENEIDWERQVEQNKADETKNVENESYNLHNNTVLLSTELFSM